jgi:hypothetical protein
MPYTITVSSSQCSPTNLTIGGNINGLGTIVFAPQSNITSITVYNLPAPFNMRSNTGTNVYYSYPKNSTLTQTYTYKLSAYNSGSLFTIDPQIISDPNMTGGFDEDEDDQGMRRDRPPKKFGSAPQEDGDGSHDPGLSDPGHDE